MAETATTATTVEGSAAPAQTQQSTEKPAEQLLAGKYKDATELQKGVRELYKTTGLAELPEGELVGDGKFFKTVQDAEKAYKRAESLIGKPKEEAPSKPISTAMFPKSEEPKPDTTKPVDAVKVFREAGFTQEEVYKMHRANALVDSVVDKLALAHEDFKAMPPRTRIPAMRALLKEEFAVVDNNYKLAADVVGGTDKLNELGSTWESYVPASEHARLAKMMNDHNMARAVALELRDYHEAKYGKSGSGPKPVSGSAPSPMTAEQQQKAKDDAWERIKSGRANESDLKLWSKK